MDSELLNLTKKVNEALDETPLLIASSLKLLHLELSQTDEMLKQELEEKQSLLKHKKHILKSLQDERESLLNSPQKSCFIEFSPNSSWEEDHQELILLYNKLSNISWNYSDSHISGIVNSKFFRFSSDSPANFYTVNKLWELMEKLNN